MSNFWKFISGPVGYQINGRINGDHTRDGSGRYCLFDTRNFFPSRDKNKDQLLPAPVPYSDICLRFWYNLPAQTSNIKVIADDREFFRRFNNITHGWVQESISIKGKEPLQVKFESTKTSLYGYLGIDDIIVEIEKPAQPSKSTLHTARMLPTSYSTKSPTSMRSLTTKSPFTTTRRTQRTVTLAIKHTGLSTSNATKRASATIIVPTLVIKQVTPINVTSNPTKSAPSVNSIMTTQKTFTIINSSTRHSTLATKHTYPAKITTSKSTSATIAKPTVDVLTKVSLIKFASTISTNSAAHMTNIIRTNASFITINRITRNITPVTKRTTQITTTTNNSINISSTPVVTRKVSPINITPTTESNTTIATREVSSSSLSKPSGLMTKQSTKTPAIQPTIVMSASKSRTTNVTRITTVVRTSSLSKPPGRTTDQSARTPARTQINIIPTTKSRTATASRATNSVSFSSPFHPPGPTTKQITRTLVTTRANILSASEYGPINATRATKAVSSSFNSKPLVNTTMQSTKTPAITHINIKQTTESQTAVPTRSSTVARFSSPSKHSGSTAKQSPRTPTVTRIHITLDTKPTNITFTIAPGVPTRTILPTDRKTSTNSRTTNSTNTTVNSLETSPAITRLETKSVIPTLTTSKMNITALTPTTTICTTLSTSIPTKGTGKFGDILTTFLSVRSTQTTQTTTPNARSTSVTKNSTISPYMTISHTLTKRFSIINISRTILQDMLLANLMSTSIKNYKDSSKTSRTPKSETNAHAETNFFNPSQTNTVSSKKQNLETTSSAQTDITQGNTSLSWITLRKFISQVTSTLSVTTTSLETKMDFNINKFSEEIHKPNLL